MRNSWASSVKDWVKEYQKALKLSAKEEGGKLIDKVVVDKSLYVRPSEKEHLVDLLSEITPRMQGDGESQELEEWIIDGAILSAAGA
ncbi:hypothetical protein AAIH29_30810, partial [Pseudomonas aeruginosa]|uniref:hypothetical protein n=1 Tax=Pseudomonas aeruginosa TaxID=287 RepID=UPI0031B7BC86